MPRPKNVGEVRSQLAEGLRYVRRTDIVLLSDDLGRLPWLIRHSRATLAINRQNIALALAIKAVVLLLAVDGRANLWMAIAADVGTSLIVIANALRLLGRRAV